MNWEPIASAPKDMAVDLWIKTDTRLSGGFRVVDCIYREDRWWSPTDYDPEHEDENLSGADEDTQRMHADMQKTFDDLPGFFEAAETRSLKATHWMLVNPPA